MSSSAWAVDQISRLLPLDEDSLKQILEYSYDLPQDEAAEHLKNLLGDSPQALEFISSFNARRKTVAPASQSSSIPETTQAPPRAPRGPKKKKSALNNLPPARRPEDYGNVAGGYQKKKEGEEYMPATGRQRQQQKDATASNPFSLSSAPAIRQLPSATLGASFPNIATRAASPSKSNQSSQRASPSNPSSRTSSPRPSTAKTKVSIPGGTPMHGASSTLSDLESAIRTLEMSTNPTLRPSEADNKARACSCMGSLHPLLTAAPNCLSCGKVICAKEGLAPCTFCGAPLLTGEQVHDMIRTLRDERGREKMAVNNAAQAQRGGGKLLPAAGPASSESGSDPALAQAMAHRDKLLNFQASNAKRTQVVDEAAAFETPDSGVSHWASAEERAQQLKRQQRVLREMEWNARPEWEKRRMVISLDVGKGGKAVRRIQEVGRLEERENEVEDGGIENDVSTGGVSSEEKKGGGGGGAFAENPLLGEMVKPVWQKSGEEQGRGDEDVGSERKEARNPWRRVQDDADDNEEIILNGGIYGGRESERIFAEEPACG